MSTQSKIVATVAVVFAVSGAALFAQYRGSRPQPITVSAAQVEKLITMLPEQDRQEISSSEKNKQDFIKFMKQVLALGREAELEGVQSAPEISRQLELQRAIVLSEEFKEKASPGESKVDDAAFQAWEKANPGSFEKLLADNPRLSAAPQEQREELRKQFAELNIVAERAVKAGLDKDPAIQFLIQFERANILAKKYQGKLSDSITVSDDETRKYYDDHKQEFEEVKASHILARFATGASSSPHGDDQKLPSREEARKKIESAQSRLKAGEDFATVAKEASEDSSAPQGGDLGFFTRGRMVKPFEDAAFSLKPGDVSDIIESQFGFHIVKVAERRAQPFETVKPQLENKLKGTKLEQKVDELIASSPIEIDSSFKVQGKADALPFPGAKPEGRQ